MIKINKWEVDSIMQKRERESEKPLILKWEPSQRKT